MNMPQDPRNGPPPVGRMVRLGLWALPVWAVLLFYSTLSHQPPPQAQFAAWARYVTTPEFLASHLIGSIAHTGSAHRPRRAMRANGGPLRGS